MKPIYFTLILAACVCGCSAPEENTAAEAALRQEIESQSKGYIKLVSFTKMDGQSINTGGLKMRQIEYTAEIEFEHRGTWLSGGWPGRLVYHFTMEVQKSQTATMALLSSIDAPIIVSAGGHAQIKGTMDGTKKDSGWQFETSESSLVTQTVSN
jgi:hypothetical protein